MNRTTSARLRPAPLRLALALSVGALSSAACTAGDDGGGEAASASESSTSSTGDVASTSGDASTTEATGGASMSATGSTTDTGSTTEAPSTGTDTDTSTGTDGGLCGDGISDAGEECDDGNDLPADGCEPDCTLSPPAEDCGNGLLDEGEQCDGDTLEISQCAAFDDKYTAGALSCANNCTYNTSLCEVCYAPAQLAPCDVNSDDILHAIGLACDTLGGDFTDPEKHIPVENFKFISPANNAYRVLTQFGSYMEMGVPLWGPTEGKKFLLISTGNLPSPNGQGVMTAPPGSAQTGNTMNANPDNTKALPGIMSDLVGSNNGGGGTPFAACDGVNDCSDTLAAQWKLAGSAHDVLYFQFDLKVPKGTYGYNVDFAYFSAEYPEWVNTSFNDMAILWSTSESYTGNVTFIRDQLDQPRPLTITALTANGLIKYTESAPQLANTGFDKEGGGTGWATVKGSTVPEETFTLAWTVFDAGDTVLDTALIIDNWRWDCAGCIPSEVDSCGIEPM